MDKVELREEAPMRQIASLVSILLVVVSSLVYPKQDYPLAVRTATSEWFGWSEVSPAIRGNLGAAVTALWANPGHLDLFMTGSDGAVWSTWWEGSRGWQPWFLIHPEVKANPGATVTALWNGGHLDLFMTGSDGAVWS